MNETCAVLREHRNKRIAHTDLKVALEQNKLKGFSRQSIEDALAARRDVLNAINLHFHMGPTMYADVIMNGTGQSLIAVLKDGLRFRELRRNAHKMSDAELKREVIRRGPKADETEDD